MKQIHHIAGKSRVAGQQPEIGVEAGRLHVIVSRTDMNIRTHAGRLFPDHKRYLAVGLEAAYTERDVSSHAFQFRGPMQIALLIKARFDLHDARDLFSALGGPDQRLDERGIVADSISRHFD